MSVAYWKLYLKAAEKFPDAPEKAIMNAQLNALCGCKLGKALKDGIVEKFADQGKEKHIKVVHALIEAAQDVKEQVIDKDIEELKKHKGAFLYDEEDSKNTIELGKNHFKYRYVLYHSLKYPIKLPHFDMTIDFPAGTSIHDFVS